MNRKALINDILACKDLSHFKKIIFDLRYTISADYYKIVKNVFDYRIIGTKNVFVFMDYLISISDRINLTTRSIYSVYEYLIKRRNYYRKYKLHDRDNPLHIYNYITMLCIYYLKRTTHNNKFTYVVRITNEYTVQPSAWSKIVTNESHDQLMQVIIGNPIFGKMLIEEAPQYYNTDSSFKFIYNAHIVFSGPKNKDCNYFTIANTYPDLVIIVTITYVNNICDGSGYNDRMFRTLLSMITPAHVHKICNDKSLLWCVFRLLISTHCTEEPIIRQYRRRFTKLYPNEIRRKQYYQFRNKIWMRLLYEIVEKLIRYGLSPYMTVNGKSLKTIFANKTNKLISELLEMF